MNSETPIWRSGDSPVKTDRWQAWLGVTLGVHIATLLIYPAAICGCHFHALAAIVGAFPILWTGFVLLAARSLREWIIAIVNLGISVGWIAVEWNSNLRFLFG
jgi:hypothetical protein